MEHGDLQHIQKKDHGKYDIMREMERQSYRDGYNPAGDDISKNKY